jgi:hypothetical protein
MKTMNRISIIVTGVSVLLSGIALLSCKNKVKLEQYHKITLGLNTDKMEQREFYNAVYREQSENVQAYLDRGFNPNYCRGECGWGDSNPLAVVAEGFYDTYYRTLRGADIPDPTPDVATLQVLVAGGADVNRRPYIWDRVYMYTNKDLDSLWKSVIRDGKPVGVEEDVKAYYIRDANRIIEAFLKAGADPDLPGHPYPFSYEAMKARITDEQAQEYFSKGTRAINEAIAKGMAWESQVDLLLAYTQLDEESLKAAERSNDPAMVRKIQKLWQAQGK